MTARLKTYTLGCKVNQYETEYVREGLLRAGYDDALDQEPADLCVVNTCTVTREGDAKSRQVIRRLARDNPHSRIIVMGCYATRAPDEVARLPRVAEVVTDKRELPDLLGRFGVVDIPTGISRFGNRHRAYVKVQDGCMLRCSYCIIPHVRPQPTSRPLQHILDEVQRLRDNGYREIVLTGVHLGHYGVEQNWRKPKSEWLRLSDLVRQIAVLDGDFRIRLSSIESTEVTRELIAVMAEYPQRVCGHLHICLQSGSDAVLRRMRRRWSRKAFVDRCRLVQETLDAPAITTDIIVGFPGESEQDFEQTCQVIGEVGFSKIHCFPFSARRGTPAAEMEGQLSKRVKAERGRRIGELEADHRKRYFESLCGKRLRVLVEGSQPIPSPLRAAVVPMVGTACRYAPVELAAAESAAGQLLDVTAAAVRGDTILAAPLE
jgi:threonylcarbamoyladenosine tRNA methylthiotransferase MtaB